MTKTQHKKTEVASMFQNGISWNTKFAIRDGFHRDSRILSKYGAIITDQLQHGFIERIKERNPATSIHYIPHHAMQKDSVTIPISVMFECRCRESAFSTSLNDCLESGPILLNDLCLIIPWFHVHNYSFVTDIEKALLYIRLHPDNRDYKRVLWLSNPNDPNSHLFTYWF